MNKQERIISLMLFPKLYIITNILEAINKGLKKK